MTLTSTMPIPSPARRLSPMPPDSRPVPAEPTRPSPLLFLLFLAAWLSGAPMLTSCGTTVAAGRLTSQNAWEKWQRESGWRTEESRTHAWLKTNGVAEEWKRDPEAAIRRWRAEAAVHPGHHRAIAVLASKMAAERERAADNAPERREAIGLWLTAAESAYRVVQKLPKQVLESEKATPERFYVALYNEAVTHFVDLQFSADGLKSPAPRTVQTPAGPVTVHLKRGQPGLVDPSTFDDLVATSEVEARGMTREAHLPGVGATFAGVIDKTPARKSQLAFSSKRGLALPLTAVLLFQSATGAKAAPTAELQFIDTLSRNEVAFASQPVRPARECAVPMALELNGLNAVVLGLGGFFWPDKAIADAGLYMLQPYDPNRIPVVFIHGVQSSPLIWRDMIAELQADPEVSKRYQFWAVYYPSGMSIPFTRRLIARQFDAVQAHFDPAGKNLASQNIVVVGHSMGGVITRALITDVGDRYWNAISDADFSEIRADEKERADFQSLVFFKPVPHIRRAVFIAAPHRGASLAQNWVSLLISRLVRLPADLVKVQLTLLKDNIKLLKPSYYGRGTPTSVHSLSPNAPIFAALNGSPPTRNVPYHSIIGVRKASDPLKSSDGFVSYESSHLDGAASEKLVPTGHSAYACEDAVDEVKRILKLHLKR